VPALALGQGLEPARRHQDVVVHERDQRRGAPAHAAVARRVEAAPRSVGHQVHPRPGRDDRRGRVIAAVVDDEQLVRDSAVLTEQRVERDLEVRRAAARGDHD
jgi:hypothetical protein